MLLADFNEMVMLVSRRPIWTELSKSSICKISIIHPKAIFLLSRNCKNEEDESFTPTNFPFSPIFKSQSKNLFLYFIKPAGLGIGSP